MTRSEMVEALMPNATERQKRLAAAGVDKRWEELGSRARWLDEERELCVLTWMTDYVDLSVGRADAARAPAPAFIRIHSCIFLVGCVR